MDASELLSVVQRHGRSSQQDRDNLLSEMKVLLHFLQMPKPDDLTAAEQGAIGGLFYCLRRLAAIVPSAHPITVLADRYAQSELNDYPELTPDAQAAMSEWGRKNNLFLRLIPISCPDDKIRFMLVSHQRQTSLDGKPYEEGEVIPNPERVKSNPPFSHLIEFLHGQGWQS